MKKKLLVILIAAFSMNFANAQGFKEGTNVLNLGLGLGYAYTYYSSASTTPVLSASFEHGVAKLGPGTVGVGAILSYQGSSYSVTDGFGTWKESWNTTYFAVRGTWHPDVLNTDKYDVYGALQLGYVHFGYSYSGTGFYSGASNTGGSSLNSGLALGLAVGGRYYLSKSIGLFGELGYDISYLKVGASIKF